MNGDKPLRVEVGQVWRDLDIRSAVDEFTVVAVSTEYAVVRRSGYAHGRPRETRIKMSRLMASIPENRARGYVYAGKQR